MAKCLRLLFDAGNVTYELLMDATGTSHSTARRLMNVLHKEGLVYISGWEQTSKPHLLNVMFTLQPPGQTPQPDVPRPRQHGSREQRRKARNRQRRIAYAARKLASNPFKLELQNARFVESLELADLPA